MRPAVVAAFAAVGVLVVLLGACRAQTEVSAVEGRLGEPPPGIDGAERIPGALGAEGIPGAFDPDALASASLAGIYDRIVDSIVFIDAEDATGTGIVIEGGWILTNAHIVERLDRVRIGRSDGTDLGEHPVLGSDWLFDLALVGPVDDDALVPFSRVRTSGLAIGDPVMLIGFPDESNASPTPTLTSGIVSRRRRLSLGTYPFLQVDATIAPGQSGGALVDVAGNLVGISGLEFGEGEFGLVFEVDAMWPRIDELFERPGVPLPSTNPVFELVDEVGPMRTFGFVLDVEDAERTELLAVSDDDLYLEVLTLTGATLVDHQEPPDPFVFPRESGEIRYFVDELLEGGEELSADLAPGTYQVIVGTFGERPRTVSITSNQALRPFADVEEGAVLPVGELVEGVVDWSGDSDRWTLDLRAGDRVLIAADGIADTVVAVRLDGDLISSSDDEQLGLFGTAARAEFVAPVTGTYEVEVGTFDEARWGYLIEVEIE